MAVISMRPRARRPGVRYIVPNYFSTASKPKIADISALVYVRRTAENFTAVRGVTLPRWFPSSASYAE